MIVFHTDFNIYIFSIYFLYSHTMLPLRSTCHGFVARILKHLETHLKPKIVIELSLIYYLAT